MLQVNIHEAKTRLSELLERVQQGEAVIIAKAGKPIAQISPLLEKPTIVLGLLEGKLHTPQDFNAPLPEDLRRPFKVKGKVKRQEKGEDFTGHPNRAVDPREQRSTQRSSQNPAD